MKLDVSIATYDSYGGGSNFGPLVALIDLDEEDFGAALVEIELTLNFRLSNKESIARAKRNLPGSFKGFAASCEKLPVRRFLRKKKRLTISVLAEFATAEEMQVYKVDLKHQHELLDVLIEEMKASGSKFKSSDDFRYKDFVEFLEGLHDQIPTSVKKANALMKRLSDHNESERDSMDEWEELGLDWSKYHPNAREVVSDPRLWCTGGSFSPNGNDDGADIMFMFRKQKARHAKDNGKGFYNKLSRDWGFDQQAKPGDSFDYRMNRNALFAISFCFLKLHANCPQWLADRAIGEIEAFKKYIKPVKDWEHKQECLSHYEAMKECLLGCPKV